MGYDLHDYLADIADWDDGDDDVYEYKNSQERAELAADRAEDSSFKFQLAATVTDTRSAALGEHIWFPLGTGIILTREVPNVDNLWHNNENIYRVMWIDAGVTLFHRESEIQNA